MIVSCSKKGQTPSSSPGTIRISRLIDLNDSIVSNGIPESVFVEESDHGLVRLGMISARGHMQR